MNNLDSIFYNSYPKIDLHGMTSDIASVYINDFIEENYKLKNECFAIIHGLGDGILAQTTEYILKRNKKVKEYKRDYFNMGVTLVKIIVDKN